MIPDNIELVSGFTIKEKPSLTYALSDYRVRGKADGRTAMKQAIYKILATERYENIIYSHNYGIELKDLIGQQTSYVNLLLPTRITEALMVDDRVTAVSDFEITAKKGIVTAVFTVDTTVGSYEVTKEVDVGV